MFPHARLINCYSKRFWWKLQKQLAIRVRIQFRGCDEARRHQICQLRPERLCYVFGDIKSVHPNRVRHPNTLQKLVEPRIVYRCIESLNMLFQRRAASIVEHQKATINEGINWYSLSTCGRILNIRDGLSRTVLNAPVAAPNQQNKNICILFDAPTAILDRCCIDIDWKRRRFRNESTIP